MLFSFVFLAIVVALTAAVGLVRTNLAIGLICSFLAVAMIAIGTAKRGAYLGQHHTFRQRAARFFLLLLPCLWMLLQAAPTPSDWLANPVWSSTSNALGFPIAGSITIDTGATLLTFAQYCAALATATVVGLLAIDRRVAEFTLYFLTFVSVSAAALRIFYSFGYPDLIQHIATGQVPGMAIFAAIGITLTCATEMRLRERLLSRRSNKEARQWAIVGLAAGATGIVICAVALLIEANPMLLFAGFFGAGVLVGIFVIREWSLSAWGRAGIIAVGTMTLLAFLAAVQSRGDAIASPSQNRAVINRMLSDTPILGSGAGTFEHLLPIYREIGHAELRKVKVAADIVTIETGRPFLWISILILCCGVVVFVGGGVSRGRDYVYPSAGAGIVVTVLILVFVNGDVLSLPVSIFVSAVAGLAWAHSRSSNESAAFSARPHIGTAGALVSTVNPYESRMRFAFALAGLVLTIEAAWVLLAERNASEFVASPFVELNSAVSIDQRDRFRDVATIAGVRGDLWAESAFAGAALLLENTKDSAGEERTRSDLTQAVRYAPYQSDVWLTFALLAEKYTWPGADPKALLKMAYYTGPNEVNLIPARLRMALRLVGGAADPEVRDMIRQDVSLIVRRLPALKPILADAYKSGSVEGRIFEEGLIAELDPDYLKTMRNQ